MDNLFAARARVWALEDQLAEECDPAVADELDRARFDLELEMEHAE